MDLLNKLNNLDPYSAFEEVYKTLKELIKVYSIKDICDKCSKYTPYMIINYLLLYGSNDIDVLNYIKAYYENLKIDNRCLVISDNHLGRLAFNEDLNKKIYNNEKCLYIAYNYAIKNNINYIIHLGDLLEGNSDITKYRLDIPSQLNYYKNIYPNVDNIKTYLLYGNHDYNMIYYNNIDTKFYKLSPNIELIGLNYSYVNFNDNMIKLTHESKMSDFYKNIELPYSFELLGHSHLYRFDEEKRKINIPSLSSLELNNGFIEIIDDTNNYIFKCINQNESQIDEKILKKHFM